MVGPVFYQEMLLGGRRSRGYVLRWLYATGLVGQLILFYILSWAEVKSHPEKPDWPVTAVVAPWFTSVFLTQQLILLLMVTPVFAAGAVTDEKSRGTLQYLLTADLSSWHVVLGKLLGRVFEMALLVLTGLPLLCFMGVFAGLEPLTLLVVVAVTTVPMFALASASLLASVWSKQTRDAVLGLYAAGGAATLVLWLLGGLHLFDPLHVLEPAWGQARLRDLQELGRRLLVYGSAWGLVAVVCFGLAVWRLRPAYLQQLEGEGRKKQARWWRVERLPVGDDPVPWKEQHVDGLAPVTFLRRFPRWLAMLLIFAVTLISSAFLLWSNRAAGTTLEELVRKAAHLHYVDLAERVTGAGKGFLIQSVAVMLLASLVVGIRCSGAVTGERERQTWEALLLTPLTARELIRGKLWGIMGASYLYVLAYAVPALVLAALPILAADFAPLFWTAIWLAVTLLAMYFVGAAGIWCSVRARTSWRSLLGTLGLGYVGGAVIALVTSPVTAMLAGIIYLFLQAFDAYYGTSATLAIGGKATFTNALLIALSLSLAAIFYGLSWYFLKDAQKWVSDRERTRHWNEVPQFRRPLYRRPADAKRPRL